MAQDKAFAPNQSASFCLGVDLGSRHLRIGLVDRTGEVLVFRREPYQVVPASPEQNRALADQLLAAVRQVMDEHPGQVAAIGIGFPGLVHQLTHRIIALPNVPSFANLDLYQEFKRVFNLPIAFENSSNAAAFAEMACGVAQGVSDWLYISIGTSVGSGLVLDGKLRRGKSGFAGEIGHININPDGIECACGSTGCLETIASVPNIVRRTRARLQRDSTSSLSRLGNEKITYEDVINAAEQGDDLARMMLERTGHFIGMAVADMINALNLSMVAIGGHPRARPFLVPAITEEARRRAFPASFEDCQIVAARLGEEAGVVGIALLAAKLI